MIKITNWKFKLCFLKLSLLTLTLFCGCYESDTIDFGGDATIYKLQNNVTFVTDTLTLYGEHLGYQQDSSYIIINDTLRINSKECVVWTESKIQFVIPQIPNQSNVYVVVNSKRVFYEKDNYYQNIIVASYPPFETKLVPAGTFAMGSDAFGMDDEAPVHDVILSKPIYVATCETTQRLYELLMQENPSAIKNTSLPVYNVTWQDAINFCNTLSLKDNLNPCYTTLTGGSVSFDTSANGWRLPTEAEWEHFAQVDFDFAISSDVPNKLKKIAWYADNSAIQPHSVGQLDTNIFGLHDVLGNVWEWCWDYYKNNYYTSSPGANPLGPLSGTERIARGGSCDDGKLLVRPQCRRTDNVNAKIGLRVVRNGN